MPEYQEDDSQAPQSNPNNNFVDNEGTPSTENTNNLEGNFDPSFGLDDQGQETPPAETNSLYAASPSVDQPSDSFDEPVPGDEVASDELNGGGEEPPSMTPESLSAGGSGGSGGRLRFLLLSTGLLFVALAGAVWFFFIRDTDQPGGIANQPTATPRPQSQTTPSASPTPSGSQGETHLECRFGLCVEVPGPGQNFCSSSFDCEEGSITPTPTAADSPEDGGTPSPTSSQSTPTPTAALGAPQATSTPAPTMTPRPTATPRITASASTPTPTPLATQLPESGAMESTLLLGSLSFLMMGYGAYVVRRKEN